MLRHHRGRTQSLMYKQVRLGQDRMISKARAGPYDQLLVSQMLQHKQSIKGLLDAETSQGRTQSLMDKQVSYHNAPLRLL